MDDNVIEIGDDPVKVYGRYSVHIFRSGTGTAKLQISHFPTEATSWTDVEKSDGTAETDEALLCDFAGSIKMVGTDVDAKCSFVKLPD